MNFAENILRFYKNLQFTVPLPKGIGVMQPFEEKDTWRACRLFYKKYYADKNKRRIIMGINPGRFGGGVTGIPFTDPIRLQQVCGIANNWPQKQELSSIFIYEMIAAFGGPEAFYRQFYFSSVSPLGFTKAGKNLNYYDDKVLQKNIKPFAIDCLNKQLAFGIDTEIAYCLGDGKNFKWLSALNKEQHFFDKIIPLSHPRFVMQYRLKRKDEYINYYLAQLSLSAANDQ